MSKEALRKENQEVFLFKFNNIKLLFNYDSYSNITRNYPSLLVKNDEINSYKYYILANLSKICKIILDFHEDLGFKRDRFILERYYSIQGWNKFRLLVQYSDEFYRILLKCYNLSKKIFNINSITKFQPLIKDLNEIASLFVFNKKFGFFKNQERISSLFERYEFQDNNYGIQIMQNILKEEEFIKLYKKDQNNVYSIKGFYKALFLLMINYNKKTQNAMEEFLQNIVEKNYLNPIKRNPMLYWPWLYVISLNEFCD